MFSMIFFSFRWFRKACINIKTSFKMTESPETRCTPRLEIGQIFSDHLSHIIVLIFKVVLNVGVWVVSGTVPWLLWHQLQWSRSNTYDIKGKLTVQFHSKSRIYCLNSRRVTSKDGSGSNGNLYIIIITAYNINYIIAYSIISHHIISYHDINYIWCCTILCWLLSFDITLCCIISYHTII